MKQPFHLKTRNIVKLVITFVNVFIQNSYKGDRLCDRIFLLWWRKGVWRSPKLHIVTAIITYGIYWSHRERGEQKQISIQSLIHDWAKLFYSRFRKILGILTFKFLFIVKLGYSEKATKIWKNLPFFWHYWVKTAVVSKQVGDFFKFCDILIMS